jgi:serine/threonine protein kinase
MQWELVAGPDLLELLNQHGGRMAEPMAAFYFLQLLRGVLFMHAAGFCHRDIKPENCMVERSSHRLKVWGASVQGGGGGTVCSCVQGVGLRGAVWGCAELLCLTCPVHPALRTRHAPVCAAVWLPGLQSINLPMHLSS